MDRTPHEVTASRRLGVPLPPDHERLQVEAYTDADFTLARIAVTVPPAYVEQILAGLPLAPAEDVLADDGLNPGGWDPKGAGLRSFLALHKAASIQSLVAKLTAPRAGQVGMTPPPPRGGWRSLFKKPEPPQPAPSTCLTPPREATTIYVSRERPTTPIEHTFLWYQDGRLCFDHWES